MLIGCLLSWFAGGANVVGRAVPPLHPRAASKLGLGDVQAELDRISSRETDSDLPNTNETPAADGQDT